VTDYNTGPDTFASEIPTCPDCGVAPGRKHAAGCDVARCMSTGQQRIQCDGTDDDGVRHRSCGRDIWTGTWPGKDVCEEYGWWVLDLCFAGQGFVRCPAGTVKELRWGSGVRTVSAIHDLNRLQIDCDWDRAQRRWVRRDGAAS